MFIAAQLCARLAHLPGALALVGRVFRGTGDDPGSKVDGGSFEVTSDMACGYRGPHGVNLLPSLEAINISGL